MPEGYGRLGTHLTPEQKLYFEQEYGKQSRSPSTALTLALLLGGVGAHRFYLRQRRWGVAYLLFFWTLIPAMVSLVECFRIMKRTREYNAQVANSIVQHMNLIFFWQLSGSNAATSDAGSNCPEAIVTFHGRRCTFSEEPDGAVRCVQEVA
jgi:TM2 domain-containing membrane protein YozV